MDNSIARMASSYEFLVFLCQFVAESISFQVVLPCSRWLQFVPGSSSLFQLVPGIFNSFKLVPCFSMYGTRHTRRLSPIFVGWNHAITWLSIHICIYELKSYWMKISFWMNITILNETKLFEWTWNFWIKLLKMIKQYKKKESLNYRMN